MGYKVEGLPIAAGIKKSRTSSAAIIEKLLAHSQAMSSATSTMLDWLRHEFGISKPGRTLSDPTAFEQDAFIAAVRDALPKTRKLTAAEIAELRRGTKQGVWRQQRKRHRSGSVGTIII